MCIKFRSDWSTGSYEKDLFSNSRSKRCHQSFGERRKKVNLSENVSRDGVDQMVWNFYSFFINVLTQCVSNFVHIGLLDHIKIYVYLVRVVRSATIATSAKVKKGQSFRKRLSGLSGPNSLKLSQFSHQCLNSMPTKFRFDWTTGSYKKIHFSTSFEALLSQLWRKSKKGQSLRSGSRDWVYQIVWNFDTFKINILTQCVFMLIFVDKGLFEHSCCQLHYNVFRLRFIGAAS